MKDNENLGEQNVKENQKQVESKNVMNLQCDQPHKFQSSQRTLLTFPHSYDEKKTRQCWLATISGPALKKVYSQEVFATSKNEKKITSKTRRDDRQIYKNV